MRIIAHSFTLQNKIVKYFLLYMLPRKHNVLKGLEMDVAHSASTFSKEYLLQTGRTFVRQLLSRFEVPASDLSRMTDCLLKLMGWLKYVHKCIIVKAWNLSIPIHTELASKTSPMLHIQIIDRTYMIPYSKIVSSFSIASELGCLILPMMLLRACGVLAWFGWDLIPKPAVNCNVLIQNSIC